VAKIRVVLGEMSAMLSDALSRLIGTQPDLRVVTNVCKNGDLVKVVRTEHADVLIEQGAAAPEPIASVIAVAPLGLLVIDRDGQAGALTRIAADSRTVSDLSGERLLQAVRSAAAGRGH
jgi:DNA-binding NarL/FixJ family response regulator